MVWKQITFWYCILIILIIRCNKELIQRPNKNSKLCSDLSLCYWYLNSITAYDFSKLSLLEACNIEDRDNAICFSPNLFLFRMVIRDQELIGCTLDMKIRVSDLAIYKKESLTVWSVTVSDLQRCLLLAVIVQNHGLFVLSSSWYMI